MKKIKIIALVLIGILCMPFAVNAASKDKINVYLFRGEGCPHCEEAIEWFDTVKKENPDYYAMYNLVDLETWNDEDNYNLMASVITALGDTGTQAGSVPYIVIGDTYLGGFSATSTSAGVGSPTNILAAIKKEYNAEERNDVVAAVQSGQSVTVNNNTNEDEKEKSDVGIIIGISVIVVIGIAGLIFAARSGK